MAEALFREDARINAAGIQVHSAGLVARAGYPADAVVASLLAERDIDISTHCSRRLRLDMVREAQLILVMETLQRKYVEVIDPLSRWKVHLLGKWEGLEIADPHRQDESAYRGCAQLVERSVVNWIQKIC